MLRLLLLSLSLLIVAAAGAAPPRCCPCTRTGTCPCLDCDCFDDEAAVTVYTYETAGKGPAWTHTWAVFAERGQPPVTISWMPSTGAVQLMRLGAQPGRNWTHAETLRHAKGQGSTVKRWGPRRCRRELVRRALRLVQRLERGELRYCAVDVGHGLAVNCVHAAALPAGPLGQPLLYGHKSGPALVKHFHDPR